jgi:hypothetical protein
MSLFSFDHHEKECQGALVWIHAFVTSALNGGEWSVYTLVALPQVLIG